MAKADEANRHPTVSPIFRKWHAADRVIFAIQRGDLAAAEVWSERLGQYPDEMSWIFAAHAPARFLVARGDKEAAAEHLGSLHERAMTAGARGYALRVRVYQALAAPTQDEAMTFLSEALEMGQPEGFIRTFVDEGKLLKPLLRLALSRGIVPDYVTKLLTIIEGEERLHEGIGSNGAAVSESSKFLSQREIEVLRLVADGLSNQQIARKLSISLNTAKTHVAHVFGKLNAKDRLQAVKRAKELEIL
jgi:LuxR family maltose regulon positive regulatory protein